MCVMGEYMQLLKLERSRSKSHVGSYVVNTDDQDDVICATARRMKISEFGYREP